MTQASPDKAEKGELSSFSLLAEPAYQPVYRFMARQVSRLADAEDLTQQAFVRAFQSFHRFDRSRDFTPWIFTIARRTLADHFRKHPEATENLPDSLTDPSPNPRESASQADQAASIWDLAGKLPPRHLQVLWLHYREQFSLRETARIMGITLPHVKVLLFRARHRLKTLLTDHPLEGDPLP